MAVKAPKKDTLTGILAVVVYLASGILTLIRPALMTDIARWTATAILAIYAIVQAVRYFRTPPAQAAMGYRLTAALIAGTLALLVATNPWLLRSDLWGLLLMCGGFAKFQTAWDSYRLGYSRWWWFMIISAVSLCFGILVLTGLIASGLAVFIGIALILEGVIDLAALFMIRYSDRLEASAARRKEAKTAKEAKAAAEQAAQEAPAPEAPAEAAPETPEA